MVGIWKEDEINPEVVYKDKYLALSTDNVTFFALTLKRKELVRLRDQAAV